MYNKYHACSKLTLFAVSAISSLVLITGNGFVSYASEYQDILDVTYTENADTDINEQEQKMLETYAMSQDRYFEKEEILEKYNDEIYANTLLSQRPKNVAKEDVLSLQQNDNINTTGPVNEDLDVSSNAIKEEQTKNSFAEIFASIPAYVYAIFFAMLTGVFLILLSYNKPAGKTSTRLICDRDAILHNHQLIHLEHPKNTDIFRLVDNNLRQYKY